MANDSAIEWTDATWNPIAGCTPVSPGCLNCYAAKMAARLDAMGQEKYRGLTVLTNGRRVFNGKITLDDDALTIPLRWKKPRRIFVNSMSDLFHEGVPFDFVDKVFAVMALCPQHTFQVLTKRPERMAEYLLGIEGEGGDIGGCDGGFRIGSAAGTLLDGYWVWNEGKRHRRKIEKFIGDTHGDTSGEVEHDEEDHREPDPVQWPLPNVWLGTSVENQKAADERIPHLLKCPAAVRFLSCEPLLGAVELKARGYLGSNVFTGTGDVVAEGVDWVIVGGESGPGARNCDLSWIGSIIDQCRTASVPVFCKQIGSKPWIGEPVTTNEGLPLKDKKGGDPGEWPSMLRVREFPTPAPQPLAL